jgi:adenosylhomocysteine nucleosidase
MRTWLVVAAEEREFAGMLRRMGRGKGLPWPHAAFAREIEWEQDRWWVIASGPGTTLVERALRVKHDVQGIISTGFCGALDPALAAGAIVVSGEAPVRAAGPFVAGDVVSSERVLVTAEEKRALRRTSGAAAVDMEFGAVKKIAAEWGVPARAVRAVSDAAGEDMPLDFNRYRDREGRFSRGRIAMAAMVRPLVIPGLLRLERNCRLAAEHLGDFFADSEF